jgi:hypothetical protein
MLDPQSFGLNVQWPMAKVHNMVVKIPLERAALADEVYMLCNPVVFGFNFGLKLWGVSRRRPYLVTPTDDPILVQAASQ